jgi:hypothetical protein
MCGSSCVDEQTDGNNCGTCGHSCLGGACSAGLCQPVTLATTGGTYLAIDTANVYWSNGTSFYSCPLSGGCGAGTMILNFTSNTAGLSTIVVPPPGTYGSDLFVATGSYASPTSGGTGGVYTIPRTGSTLTTDPGYPTTSLAFAPVQGYLFSETLYPGTPQTVDVTRQNADGSGYETLFTGLSTSDPLLKLGPIAVDAANVYIGDNTDAEVLSCPITGTTCTPTIVVSFESNALYSDGTNLWVAAYGTATSGQIAKCPTNASCNSGTHDFATTGNPGGIIADSTNVYWSEQNSNDVLKCPIAGCGSGPVVVGAAGPTPMAVAVDSAAVYWVDSQGVRKVAK